MATAAVKYFYATGRRKTSSARVFLRPGSGKFEVNGKTLDKYMSKAISRMVVQRPLVTSELNGKFDVTVSVTGGGETGQAGAISLGVARALVSYDEQLRPTMRKAGFLTRDPRAVERKKYGLAGARRRYQYSKR